MTLKEKQIAFVTVLDEFLHNIIIQQSEKDVVITLGELERPQWVQDIYVKEGKSKKKVSGHSERRAIDLNVYVDGVWQDGKTKESKEHYRWLGELWEEIGRDFDVPVIWGGRFGVPKEAYDKEIGWDARHFEVL